MSRIINIIKTLRNNWKKSTFALCVVSYGANYGIDKIRTDEMMRGYCEEALKYGRVPLPLEEKPRHVTVILNPAAKKKKCKDKFEKFCAPLLHLAGLSVSVVQTEAEGQARGLMEVMSNTDAVAIAGGDGTFSEAVTGLLRRQDAGEAVYHFPLAVLPLGRTNVVSASVFGQESHEAKHLAEATMALIRGARKSVDVMKIEAVQTDVETKPVYAVAEVQWGAYRDVHARRDKYWYWGPWRAKAAFVFSWPKSEITWDCQAELRYTAPCSGCRQCKGIYLQPEEIKPKLQTGSRWWQAFIPKPSPSTIKHIDYSAVENPDCGLQHTLKVSSSDLSIATVNARPFSSNSNKSKTPALNFSIGPSQEQLGFSDFVKEGWSREYGAPKFTETLTAREIWLTPIEQPKDNTKKEDSEETQKWLSIDQENFELRPMHITLLPKRINLFCPLEQMEQ